MALALAASAQINSPNGGGLLSRGLEMARQGNFSAALDQLLPIDRSALDADTRSEVELAEARWLYGAGRYAEALSAFDAYVRKYPQSSSLQSAAKGYADCFYALNNYDKALKAYSEVLTDGLVTAEASELFYRKGLSAYNVGKVDVAKAALTEATTYRSTRSAASFYLGRIAYDQKDYGAARERFRMVNTAVAPGDVTDCYLAAIDFAEGNYGRALSTARQGLKRSTLPSEAKAELNRIAGESLFRQGQLSDACSYLKKYTSATSNPVPSALYVLGVQAFNLGNYNEALDYLRPVTEHADGALQQSAYLFAGQCLLENGDTSAAILAFDKAAKVDYDPEVREAAFYNYAAAKFAGASVPFASTSETFEEFLRLYPDGPYSDRVASYLASGYMADNDYERALSRLNAINSPSPRMQAAKQRVLYTLGMKSLREGNYAVASDFLNDAHALRSFDATIAAEVVLAQAQVLQANGNNTSAIDKFRTYLRTADKNAQNRPVALYGLAYSLYNTGDAKGAMTNFSEASTRISDPTTLADIYNRLGDVRFALGDFSEAADFYAKAFKTNPGAGDYASLNAAKMKGYLRDYEGKLQALDVFRRDFSSSVLMPDALLETTQAQISLGRNADAVATYKTLIKSYPQTAQGRRGYLQMAMTLLDMGQTDEAAKAYRSVIQLYPTSAEAAQASSLLKNLYIGAGRGDEYLDFMASVDNAPKITEGEAEELAFESACTAFRSRGETAQLENFAAKYQSSPHAAEALGILLDKAKSGGNDEKANALADRIIDRYPDSQAAETALLLKADAAYSASNLPEALAKYESLTEKASDAATATSARLGLMRTARDMGEYAKAGEAADAIIASSATPAAISEAKFTKAVALDADDKTTEAIAIWKEMSSDTNELFGAKSAYEAASALHEAGKNKEALKIAQDFVQSGSPHRYWIARGFILLSDIYTAQGKDFEAREYLEALRDNYPGSEPDIFMMIDSRLSDKKQEK